MIKGWGDTTRPRIKDKSNLNWAPDCISLFAWKRDAVSKGRHRMSANGIYTKHLAQTRSKHVAPLLTRNEYREKASIELLGSAPQPCLYQGSGLCFLALPSSISLAHWLQYKMTSCRKGCDLFFFCSINRMKQIVSSPTMEKWGNIRSHAYLLNQYYSPAKLCVCWRVTSHGPLTKSRQPLDYLKATS